MFGPCRSLHCNALTDSMALNVSCTYQVFIAMGRLKNSTFFNPATWLEVTMELLRLCVPRTVAGIEQEWPFQSSREELAKIILVPMADSVIYSTSRPEQKDASSAKKPKRKKKITPEALEDFFLSDMDRTWLEDVMAMMNSVLDPLPEDRVDKQFKLGVLRKCLCFALTKAATVQGKTVTKWSKLRKEMKAALFREHTAVILSQQDVPKRGLKRKGKDAEAEAPSSAAGSDDLVRSRLASRILGEESLKLRTLAAEKCTIEDADKQMVSAFLVHNSPKKNIKLHPMRMQLVEAALLETRGRGRGRAVAWAVPPHKPMELPSMIALHGVRTRGHEGPHRLCRFCRLCKP